MEIYREGSDRSKYDFYFNVELKKSIILITKALRSEEEYDNDEYAQNTMLNYQKKISDGFAILRQSGNLGVLNYLKKISDCFDDHVYLLVAEPYIKPPSKFRSRRGLLWQENKLNILEKLNFEVDAEKGNTRLGTILDLHEFTYDHSAETVLNWVDCLIILSKLDMNTLLPYAKEWLSKDRKSMLSINYNAVANDLRHLITTAVLRYFPADNGRYERIAILSNEDYFKNNIEKCICSII